MSGEGYAYFYWHRAMGYPEFCGGINDGRMCAIWWRQQHALIPAPSPPPKRTYVGWFIPNSADLRGMLLAIHRTPGKRIHVEPLENGPVKFYAEDV